MPRRILQVLVSVLLAVFTVVLPAAVAEAATGCVPTTGSTGYTVTVCLTAPADGAVLAGTTTVSATATITGGASTLRVSGVTFCVDSAPCTRGPAYLLKDFSPDASGTFSFTLDTRLYADRTTTLYAYAQMNDGLVSQPSSEAVTFQNGQSSPSPVPSGFTIRPGTQAGADGLVVAAVGDSGDGRTQQAGVSNLIAGWDPNLFLYLGDVYEKGSPSEFSNWYSSGFSRFDPITNPTVGNHEYSYNSTAEGYMRYWKSPPHYYSYDAGGWHFVSLDSTDKFNRSVSGVQQTQPGTGGVRTMYDWLASDLAAHSSACTIVYYHEPLWNQGEESPTTRMATIWSLLAQQRVSLVLNGHDHDYQRFPAVDGSGNPTPTGVTEIISGGGGHGTQVVTPGKNPGPDPVVYASIAGALKLTLHPDRADFVTTALSGTSTRQVDSGSVPCQSAAPDTTPPTQPVLAAPQASSTANGPQVSLSWTAATDDRGVAGYRVRRDGTVVSGDLPATSLTWTDTTVRPSTQYTYTVEAFDAVGNASLSGPRTVTTPAAGQVVIQAPASQAQDTYASASSPAAKGSATTVKVSSPASTSGEQITYLKFNVAGTSGIGKATLMLDATSSSSAAAATVYAVPDTSWSESTLTWTSRPAIGVAAAAPPTPGLTAGQWKSWDVTDLVSGNGWVGLALRQTGTNATAMSFASKENVSGPFAPKLVIDPPTGTAPSAPSGLTATARDQNTVLLSWQPPASGAVDHYTVYRGGALVGTASPVASPSYTDGTVSAGTTYTYTVAAVDSAGNSSAQSAPSQVTTPT